MSSSDSSDICVQTATQQIVSGNLPNNLGVFSACSQDVLNASVRYCLASGYFGNGNAKNRDEEYIGLCVPSNCTPAGVQKMVATYDIFDRAGSVFCSGEGAAPWTSWQALALAILLIMAFAVLIATFVDYMGFFSIAAGATASPQQHQQSPGQSPQQQQQQHPAAVLQHQHQHQQPLLHNPNDNNDADAPSQMDTTLDSNGHHNNNNNNNKTHHDDASSAATNQCRSRVHFLIDCFSLIANFERWRHFPRGETTNVFSSVRVLCVVWILTTWSVRSARTVPGYEEALDEHNIFYSLVYSTAAPIRTFCFLSGFISLSALEAEGVFGSPSASPSAAAVVQRTASCGKLFCAYISLLARRWLRLTPLYMATIFLAHPALSRLGGGPYWEIFVSDPTTSSNCGKQWWANLLYINNFVPYEDPSGSGDASADQQRCFPWSFYLAIDLQFTALAPLLLLAHQRLSRRAFHALTFALCVLSSLALLLQSPPPSRRNTSEVQQPQLLLIPFLAGMYMYILRAAVQRRAAEALFFVDNNMLQVLSQANNQNQQFATPSGTATGGGGSGNDAAGGAGQHAFVYDNLVAAQHAAAAANDISDNDGRQRRYHHHPNPADRLYDSGPGSHLLSAVNGGADNNDYDDRDRRCCAGNCRGADPLTLCCGSWNPWSANTFSTRLTAWLERKTLRIILIWSGIFVLVGDTIFQWGVDIWVVSNNDPKFNNSNSTNPPHNGTHSNFSAFSRHHNRHNNNGGSSSSDMLIVNPNQANGIHAIARVAHSLLWSLGLFCVLTPLLFGYGGLIRRILSHRLWCGASRLVLAAYLIGPLVVSYGNAVSSGPRVTTWHGNFGVIWANLWLTFAFAFLLHVLVEQPIVRLTSFDVHQRLRAAAENYNVSDNDNNNVVIQQQQNVHGGGGGEGGNIVVDPNLALLQLQQQQHMLVATMSGGTDDFNQQQLLLQQQQIAQLQLLQQQQQQMSPNGGTATSAAANSSYADMPDNLLFAQLQRQQQQQQQQQLQTHTPMYHVGSGDDHYDNDSVVYDDQH